MRAGGSLVLVLLLVGSALAGCLQSSTIENSETEPEPEIPEPEPEPLDPNRDHDDDGFTTGWELANGWDPEDALSAPECNRFRQLCRLGVHETVWATSHNSHASLD